MIQEFTSGAGACLGVDVGKVLVLARIEQLTHGSDIGDGYMANLGRGNRLDKLGGQQPIAVDALGNHELGRNGAQYCRDCADHCEADQRVPAQHVERWLA